MPDNGRTIRGGIATISGGASRVAEHTNIRDIRLASASAELKSFAAEGPFTWDLDISPSAHYQEGDRFFVLAIGYAITIERPDDADGEESDKKPEEVAEISFQFAMLCELDEESASSITREAVEEYTDAAAKIVLGPYVREYVHDVTMRMGLPTLVVDILPSWAEQIPS